MAHDFDVLFFRLDCHSLQTFNTAIFVQRVESFHRTIAQAQKRIDHLSIGAIRQGLLAFGEGEIRPHPNTPFQLPRKEEVPAKMNVVVAVVMGRRFAVKPYELSLLGLKAHRYRFG